VSYTEDSARVQRTMISHCIVALTTRRTASSTEAFVHGIGDVLVLSLTIVNAIVDFVIDTCAWLVVAQLISQTKRCTSASPRSRSKAL